MAIDPTLLTGAGIGGVIIATCWGMSKVIPAVAKAVKSNNKNSGKNNTLKSIECKPGKAQICIDRGIELTEHKGIMNKLVADGEKAEEDRKEIKKEIKSGFSSIHSRLDKLWEK